MMHKHDKQQRVVKACAAFSYIYDRWFEDLWKNKNNEKSRWMWPSWWLSGEERELPSASHVQNSRNSKSRSVTNTSTSFPHKAFGLLKGPTVGFMKGEQCSCIHSPHQHCGLPLPYLWNEKWVRIFPCSWLKLIVWAVPCKFGFVSTLILVNIFTVCHVESLKETFVLWLWLK